MATPTLKDARQDAESLRIETDDDGAESYYLGNRELQPGDVVELFVSAGAHSQWKTATLHLDDDFTAKLQTNSGGYSITTRLLLRWPVESPIA